MLMSTYFLNHRSFSSKDGKTYNVLTVCDPEGEVTEFFHDSDIPIPQCKLFDALDLDISAVKFKGGTRLVLRNVYPVLTD